jgi:hypothetical protein
MAIKTPDNANGSEKPNEEKIQKTITKEIDVDLSDEPQRMQVDFEDESIANSFATSQTKPSKDSGSKIAPDKSVSEIQDEIADYEKNKSGIATHKDLLKQAKFIIGMYDTGSATVCDMISGNKSRTSNYKMLPEEKELLSGQLALILAKYQHKFKIEYSFLAGLLLIAGANVTQAVQDKKKNKAIKIEESKEIKTEKVEKKPGDEGYKHKPGANVAEVPKSESPQQPLEHIDIPGSPSIPPVQPQEEKPKRKYTKRV